MNMNLLKKLVVAATIAIGLGAMNSQYAQAQTKSEASAFASAQAWARTKGMVLMQRPMPQSPEELHELRNSTGIIFSPTSKLGEQVNVFGKGMTFRGQRHEALDVMYWDAKNNRTAVRECNNEGVLLFVVTPLEAIAKAGARGQAGAAGPQGPQGYQGVPGQNGTPGSQGPQGYTGPAGSQGSRGPRGYQGPQGSPGRVYYVQPLETYVFNSVEGPKTSTTVIQEQTKGLFDYIAPILGAYVGRTQIGSTILSSSSTGGTQVQAQQTGVNVSNTNNNTSTNNLANSNTNDTAIGIQN